MPLTPEQIAAIYEKKAAPVKRKASTGGEGKPHRRLTRTHTQYAKLPSNHLVYHINEYSKPCTSYGCGAPSNYSLRGSPLCQMHMIFALVHEINLLSHNGEIRATHTSGTSEPSAAVGSLVDGTPQNRHNGVDVPLVYPLTSEEGEDGDNQYL